MSFEGKSILIVDDYATLVRIISRMAQDLGFEVIDSASDGEEALRKMRDGRYNFVLCRWNLEGVTGPDIAKAWHEEPALGRSILVMQGFDREGAGAMRSRVDGFIAKPFATHDLRRSLMRAVERHQLSPQDKAND